MYIITVLERRLCNVSSPYSLFTVNFLPVNEDGLHHTLTAGVHRWRFAFRLPAESLPSSFEGEHGAIRWFLKVEVDKPFPSINSKWYRTFTVLSRLDMNEPVYQVSQQPVYQVSRRPIYQVGQQPVYQVSQQAWCTYMYGVTVTVCKLGIV